MKPLMRCLALGNHLFHTAIIIILFKSLLGGAREHTQEPREKVTCLASQGKAEARGTLAPDPSVSEGVTGYSWKARVEYFDLRPSENKSERSLPLRPDVLGRK